jgi:hypothetical protein
VVHKKRLVRTILFSSRKCGKNAGSVTKLTIDLRRIYLLKEHSHEQVCDNIALNDSLGVKPKLRSANTF